MKKHFVLFFSPGTLVAEQTQKPINSWDIDDAVRISKNIKERHNSKPYGFQFVTRERKEDDFDSKEIKRSHMYFLGGKVLTLAEVKAKNDPNDRILIFNMENNGYDRIIINNNSWKWTQPLNLEDVILDV